MRTWYQTLVLRASSISSRGLWARQSTRCLTSSILTTIVSSFHLELRLNAPPLVRPHQPLILPLPKFQVIRDLCLSGQISCYVPDMGVKSHHQDFLAEGFFLQSVSKGQ
jgi:hypothetical protein